MGATRSASSCCGSAPILTVKRKRGSRNRNPSTTTRSSATTTRRRTSNFIFLLMCLEVDRGVDQGLLALAPPEPRHRLPERRVGLDLVDVEAPRPRVALVPAEEPVRRPVWKSNFRRATCVWLISTQAVAANSPCTSCRRGACSRGFSKSRAAQLARYTRELHAASRPAIHKELAGLTPASLPGSEPV